MKGGWPSWPNSATGVGEVPHVSVNLLYFYKRREPERKAYLTRKNKAKIPGVPPIPPRIGTLIKFPERQFVLYVNPEACPSHRCWSLYRESTRQKVVASVLPVQLRI